VLRSAFEVTVRIFPDGTVKYYERSSAELSNSFQLQVSIRSAASGNLIHPPVGDAVLVNFFGATHGVIDQPRATSLFVPRRVGDHRDSGEQSAEPILVFNTESTWG
jgi:hypothetical protein